MSRSDFSRPIRLALEEGLITAETKVLDYGCGRGDDVRLLQSHGIPSTGWDPVYQPDAQLSRADVVNLGYVINVIESHEERAATVERAWDLTERLLIVSARLSMEANRGKHSYLDGCVTQRGTFQKYYEQGELREWIDDVLGVMSVPAAPGIFYVFRNQDQRESFLASRYRRRTIAPRVRVTDDLFERKKALLEPLVGFVAERGRLPDISELENGQKIQAEFGSIKRAFNIVQKATGFEQWNCIREERSQDLLVYFALSHLSGIKPFSSLPRGVQLDVRAFFSTYKRACSESKTLLFSAGDRKAVDEACLNSTVGKLTPEALYVHATALPFLPHVLRVYEGCARTFAGVVDGANVVKLNRFKPKVSYLFYPEFESDPHPALRGSLVVDLQLLRLRYWDFSESENPPILHRKEAFVHKDHPLWQQFAALTEQEEEEGLFVDTKLIGTRKGWESILRQKGLSFSGHCLVKAFC